MADSDFFRLYRELDSLEGVCRCLVQTPRRQRGAWVKPGLAGSAQTLETALLKSYRQLAQTVLASLRGAADDVASGRLAQAPVDTVSDNEIEGALGEYEVPEAERDHPVDRSRWSAILLLLLRWRQRHTEIAADAITTLFEKGHAKALADAKQRSQMPLDTLRTLKEQIGARYSADLDRLEAGLRDGTVRVHGLEWIVAHAATVGEAAAFLHRLLNSEQYRVSMFAESLAWAAWESGYRAGAVDATRSALLAVNVTLGPNMSVHDLDTETLKHLPKWLWSGPDDENTCAACLAEFGDPVVALDITHLPDPETVCSFGRACRHYWVLAV